METIFYGQEKVVKELQLIAKACRAEKNFNIMFSAPSGYGKTTLAMLFIEAKGLIFSSIGNPPNFSVDLSRRYLFLDEIHLLKTPTYLFSIMDSGDHTFIFATNESGNVFETLLNRCVLLEFSDYTDGEAAAIFLHNMEMKLPDYIIDMVLRVTSNNPRRIVNLSLRLKYLFNDYGIPDNADSFSKLLFDILDLDVNGYNSLQRRYLQYLEDIGGKGSLDTLTFGLKVNKETLMRDVEPKLLKDKKIILTSKGRILVKK
jgi:Holliday junction resolvasome RuvABC ATP-dependent DNA helicase subunit